MADIFRFNILIMLVFIYFFLITLPLDGIEISQFSSSQLYQTCACSPTGRGETANPVSTCYSSWYDNTTKPACLGIVDIDTCRHYLDPQLPAGRLNLREEDFSLNKTTNQMCFQPSLIAGENGSTLKAFVLEVNMWEHPRYIHYVKIACFFPNGIETREQLEQTLCCGKLKNAVTDRTYIKIDLSSIPPTHGNQIYQILFRPKEMKSPNLEGKKAEKAISVTNCPMVTYPPHLTEIPITTPRPTSRLLTELEIGLLVCGVVVILLCVAALLCFCFKRGRRTKGSDGLKNVELVAADTLSLDSAHEAMLYTSNT